MRKLIIFFILPILFMCTKETTEPDQTYPIDVLIRISGTDSLIFSGQYGNSSTLIDVDGVIPTPVIIGDPDYVEYSTSIENAQDEVFASFRKEQAEGTLTVRIGTPISNWGFETKREASTTASYGSVYISWKP